MQLLAHRRELPLFECPALKVDQLDTMVRERTAQIEYLSLHDRLTGLPNRALLMERIVVCLKRRQRHPEYKLAVLFFDWTGSRG